MKYCLECGKELTIKKDKNKKYCDNKCQQDFQYHKKVKLWKEGKLKTTSGDYQIARTIRRYLFEKYDSKCTQCGWNKLNEKTGLCPLDVEHIDGDSDNDCEENLTLLCPNCHSLTPTYKSLNKGSGRKQRMVIYREGKTF